jgi:hypothetical protein
MMDVPVLTAVIGVAASSLADASRRLLISSSISGERKRSLVRIASRLIDGDLGESESVISCSLKIKRWWPSELEPGMKAWEEHRHVLASYLSYETWANVQRAVMTVHLDNKRSARAHAAKQTTMDDEDTQSLARSVEYIEEGRTGLLPYLWEPKFSRRLVAAYLRQSPTGRVSPDHPWGKDQVATPPVHSSDP